MAVHQFVMVVTDLCPVHDIDGKVLLHGADDFIPVFIRVDVFPLIGGAHIQLAAKCHHALNAVCAFFFVVVNQFPDS